MYLHQSRKMTQGSNFAIATSYLIFAFALVSFVFAAAVPGPGTLRSQRRSLLYSISHPDDSLRFELASRGTAHSSTSNPPDIEEHNAPATAQITGRNVAIVHLPNSTPQSYHSEHIQEDVTKAIGVLLKAACKQLGINPPGDVRRSFQVYGYIGKMDMKTEQYEFVVQILRGGVSGGSLGDEWIECKGRVGYWYHKNGMVVSGRVVDPKGKPIVTLNANGLLIAKPELPEESSGDSHKPTKMGGKKLSISSVYNILPILGRLEARLSHTERMESSQSLLVDMYFLRHHRVVQTTNNFVIAMLYLMFTSALVPSILAAAVLSPATLDLQRRISLRSTYPVHDLRRAKLDPRGGAQSSLQTYEMIQMSDVSATETAKLMQRAVAIIHFPNPTRPSKKDYSKKAQKCAIEGTSKLLGAAMTELGINLPDSELRKVILVYGFIGKPDPTWAQYDFKVEFLMRVGKGGDDKGEWMDCKGRVGYTHNDGKMKVSGSILNPEGKRIVRLRKGKIFHKNLPNDSGGDSHVLAETGGKVSKVHWADNS
ncbi:MAG: hypothetical protein NXY57DRAFT_1041826 [Lentinula lateritia]|nr:MAG: hypothetical protein NXY57DRAFT_1041826 [Lentinula lateritia]